MFCVEQEAVDEKIKARAERFGGFQSDGAKKVARAARCEHKLIRHNWDVLGFIRPDTLDLVEQNNMR